MNTPRQDSFRVPNSLVQNITTTIGTEFGETARLNCLNSFETVTLLGLLALVNPKDPEAEVRTTMAEIMEIVEVGRTVDHTVDREWTTRDGETRRRSYQARRYHPQQLRAEKEALLCLFNKSVVLQRLDRKTKRKREDRVVHILDSFGYTYECAGKPVDLHALPAGAEKVNVGTEKRPVYQLQIHSNGEKQTARPTGIVFRLNSELARELSDHWRGTIGFTIVARKVFGLFRRHMRTPAFIRLTLLVLRQTDLEFTRKLKPLLNSLGLDATHPTKALGQLELALGELKSEGLIAEFAISTEEDQLRVSINRDWHKLNKNDQDAAGSAGSQDSTVSSETATAVADGPVAIDDENVNQLPAPEADVLPTESEVDHENFDT